MNTSNKSNTGRDGSLLTGILCAVSAVTISAPVFSLVFNTSEPDPYANLNGILVREEGNSPTVNVNRTRSTFKIKETVATEATNFVYAFDAETSETDGRLSFDELEQFSISDQISELTPPAITLPAAQGSVQVVKATPSPVEKVTIDPTTVSSEYESASDFVGSLYEPEQPSELTNLTAAN